MAGSSEFLLDPRAGFVLRGGLHVPADEFDGVQSLERLVDETYEQGQRLGSMVRHYPELSLVSSFVTIDLLGTGLEKMTDLEVVGLNSDGPVYDSLRVTINPQRLEVPGIQVSLKLHDEEDGRPSEFYPVRTKKQRQLAQEHVTELANILFERHALLVA